MRRNVLTIVLVGLSLLAQSLAPVARAQSFAFHAGVENCVATQKSGDAAKTAPGTGGQRHCDDFCLLCQNVVNALSIFVALTAFEPMERVVARPSPANGEHGQRLGENPNAPVRAGPFHS